MPYSFAAYLARFGPEASYPAMDLTQARSYCARLTRSHYENFSVASVLLPRRLLPHFYPVYAYCRWADDLGDETGGGQHALDLLAWWRGELLALYAGKVRHPVMIALQPTVERFGIPPEPFLNLLTAFEQDQRIKSYRTFDELLGYCRNSADPVGRLVLYLGESFDDRRAALSDRICTGLQLANFWQDVRRDWLDLGRVYLPEEDCARFNVKHSDFQEGHYTPAFRALMQFQVERTRTFFREGEPLLDLIPRELKSDITLFLQGGLAILQKIEQVDYDVLTERPRLSKWAKGRLLLGAVRQRFLSGTTPPLCVNSTYENQNRIEPRKARKDTEKNRLEDPVFLPCLSVSSVVKSVLPYTSVPRSFAWCRQLTKRTAGNFYLSFAVLPRRQRQAMDALYAFMRVTDDLADEEGKVETKRRALAEWRTSLDDCLKGRFSHPLHPALRQIVRQYGIPSGDLHAVIDGVEMDLQPVRFNTFAELYEYCYRVASAVGLCCIHIWGFEDERAKEYAKAAGIAFQLTNILRDLGEDLERGRIYLPDEDLQRFGCTLTPDACADESFRQMMRFQVERARSYFRKAEELDAYLTAPGRAIFQVMRRTYRGLLEEIERRDYDVFTQRVRLSRSRKIGHLLAAFPVRWGFV